MSFVWSLECQQAFEQLKDSLTSAPVLAAPDGTDGFKVYTDASGSGLGCVLRQRGRVIAYVSRQLKPGEQTDPVQDLERAVVVHAIKI